MNLSENSIERLLQVAGVSPSDKKAEAWLRQALTGARSSYQAAEQRPIAADHNNLLADIEKTAKQLIKRIERLRRYPVSWYAFWRFSPFGPVYLDRVELQEALSTLENIVSAAAAAKDPRKGRRGEAGKQHVVDRVDPPDLHRLAAPVGNARRRPQDLCGAEERVRLEQNQCRYGLFLPLKARAGIRVEIRDLSAHQ